VTHAQAVAYQVAGKVAEQTGAFTGTRDAMPEVVQVRAEGGVEEWPVIDSFTTSDHEADQARAKEAERQARQLMATYQGETNSRLSTMPQFVPPGSTMGGVDLPGGQQVNPGQHGGGGPTVSAAAAGGGGGAGGVGGSGPVTPSSGALGGGGGVPAGSGTAAPQPTPVQGYIPGAGPGAGAAAGDAERPATRPGMGNTPSGGFVPGGPGGRAGTAGGRAPWAAGRGPATGGRAAGGGFGPRGSGSGVGGGPGAGGGPGRGPESAARPGTGGPSGQAGGAAGRGAGGPAGRVAGGFVPFGGAAGRGQGGDDRERQRPSYLIEQDPNAIVGKLPPTVPPVIGEDDD
jgi:hypothetical protein